MKVKLQTKHGRPMRRFGNLLTPDAWVTFDLDEQQLAMIKADCLRSVVEGGTLRIDPNPWAADSVTEADPIPPAPPVIPVPSGPEADPLMPPETASSRPRSTRK